MPNAKTSYMISAGDEEFTISNEDVDNLNLLELAENRFHLLQANLAYHIEILYANFSDKILSVSVNGNTYQVSIADTYDQMIAEMGLLINKSQKMNEIKAPMPGLILNVLVEVGQKIEEGTPLLVLSAMKMENIILSQGEGIVKDMKVKKDDAVEKGQLIIEME